MSHTEVSIQRDWIELQLGDSLSLKDAAGLSLRIEPPRGEAFHGSGCCVWLTEEGRPDDVFLCEGDAYRVRGTGRVVLTVWRGAARLRLTPPTVMPAQAARPRSLSGLGRGKRKMGMRMPCGGGFAAP
ncbi:MAG: DUF2917 domain-containing protein [Pseudomonadota bacterium]